MSSNIDWNEVIKKEARGLKNEHLGEVHEVTNGYVLVQKGLIHKEKFYIPQDQVESYDGHVLRFKISADEVNRYAGDSHPASIEDQYESTIDIDSGGGSAGGIEIEETKVPLTDEKLNVSKETQQSQATITKEPVKEIKKVEVTLTHEEVTIETRPPSGETQAQEPVSSKEVITIPVKKEVGEVTKTPYVKEEVVVKKKPITETKEVTEETTSERVNTQDV
jgi:uncharacterized protein (TIGR02271 family)